MQKCTECGLYRPESQTVCDCGGRHDEKSPIYSGILLSLGIAVEAIILFLIRELPGAGLAAGGFFMLIVIGVVGVSLVSVLFAVLSYRRGERRAWLLAVGGIVAWFGTLTLTLR